MHIEKRLMLIVLGLAIVIGLGTDAGAESVKIGYVQVFDDAPVIVSKAEGLYEEEGLEVDFRTFTNGPAVAKGLITGDLDIGVMGFSNAFTWSAKGANLRIIGKVQEGYHAIVARNDTGIDSVKGLKGKTLASQKIGSTADIVLDGVIFTGSEMTRQDVHMVYTSPATAMQSLISGRVEAAFLFEPFATMAKLAIPTREIFEVGKEWPFPCMVLVTTQEFIDKYPETVEAVLRANKASVEFMHNNRQRAVQVLAEDFIPSGNIVAADGTSISALTVASQAMGTQTYDWRITKADGDRMNELAGLMYQQGILDEKLNVDSILDLSWQDRLARER